MEALAPLACNNLYHKSFWTHDDVNESRLSLWFAFYQSFVLWSPLKCWSVTRGSPGLWRVRRPHVHAVAPLQPEDSRPWLGQRGHGTTGDLKHICRTPSEPETWMYVLDGRTPSSVLGRTVQSNHSHRRSAAGTLNILHVPIWSLFSFLSPLYAVQIDANINPPIFPY